MANKKKFDIVDIGPDGILEPEETVEEVNKEFEDSNIAQDPSEEDLKDIYEGRVINHIYRVQTYLVSLINLINNRALRHDRSKLDSPEKDALIHYNEDKLHQYPYGSSEWRAEDKAQRADDKVNEAYLHHVKSNFHHPESYLEGVNDMDLIDLLELVADLKADSQEYAGLMTMEEYVTAYCEMHRLPHVLLYIFMNTLERF